MPAPTGGTITTDGPYTVHTFLTDGTFDPNGNIVTVEYLCVAGGGASKSAQQACGGGGGGGVLDGIIAGLTTPQAITVGIGGNSDPDEITTFGNGKDSSIGALVVSTGGGSAQGGTPPDGDSGGSGGGGSSGISSGNPGGSGGAGVPGQGFDGGAGGVGSVTTSNRCGGGGGGAGGGGGDGIAGSPAGDGGPGVEWPSGSGEFYGGGGGGGRRSNAGGTGGVGGGGDGSTGNGVDPENGTDGRGGGGGGTGFGSTAAGGNGGSGVVIIRYTSFGAPPVVTPPTDTELLDLTFGTRSSTFRFDLLDAANQPVGFLEIDVTAGYPRITNNVNRTIKRTMEGLCLPPHVTADINPLVHRVKPWMILENGSEYPLGIFLFADLSDERYTFGDIGHGTLNDQGIILDQPAAKGSGYAAGVLYVDAIADQFRLAGLTTWDIDPTITGAIGAPVSFPAGTRRSASLKVLCEQAGAYTPWFSNDGLITVRAVDDLATATPDLIYYSDQRSRVFYATMTSSSDVLAAPNQYVVIDGSAAASAVVGIYDIPPEAPHSFRNRGYHVTKVIDADGVQSQAAAVAMAQAAYGSGEDAAFEFLSFDTPPDPRHDTYQVVTFDDVNYLEESWTFTLGEGAPMSHKLRRSYSLTTSPFDTGGGGAPLPPADPDHILLESGDNVLLENSDLILLE